MKALACGACGDIQALQTEWRICKCGITSGHWVDPYRGTAEFRKSPEALQYSYILGLNNHLLSPALRGELGMFEDYRKAHDRATKAPNHVFDESRANCWAVVIKVGRTSDVSWAEDDGVDAINYLDESE